jgi:hypothetical protein
MQWAISSVGSEHLPYKQGVTSSSLVSPTTESQSVMKFIFIALFLFACILHALGGFMWGYLASFGIEA